jgi:hypothetical protein
VTDAGHLHVLVDLVSRQGNRLPYEELEGAVEGLTVAGIRVRVAGLDDIIASTEYAGCPKNTMPTPRRIRGRAAG